MARKVDQDQKSESEEVVRGREDMLIRLLCAVQNQRYVEF